MASGGDKSGALSVKHGDHHVDKALQVPAFPLFAFFCPCWIPGALKGRCPFVTIPRGCEMKNGGGTGESPSRTCRVA